MTSDSKPELMPHAIVWVRTSQGYWPGVILRCDESICSVRLLADHQRSASDMQVPRSKVNNYQLNLHRACVTDPHERKRLHTACVAAQNAGLPVQRSLFALDPFKKFVSLLQPNESHQNEDNFFLPALNEFANNELRVAHNHLRATDAALRSKRTNVNEVKNRMLVEQLHRIAVQCRTIAIERQYEMTCGVVHQIEDEMETLLLSRKAALAYYRTLEPNTSEEPVAEVLERVRNEAAHWKRQYEQAQKQLTEDNKRRKKETCLKSEVHLLQDANENATLSKTMEEPCRNSHSNKECTAIDSYLSMNSEIARVLPNKGACTEHTTAPASCKETKEKVQTATGVDIKLTSTSNNTGMRWSNEACSSGVSHSQSKCIDKQIPIDEGRSSSPMNSTVMVSQHTNSQEEPTDILAEDEEQAPLGSIEEALSKMSEKNKPQDIALYLTAKESIGRTMVSKRYANHNLAPNDPERAFSADIQAFHEETGERGPRPITIDGNSLCLYKLMRVVCGLGGIRNVVQNGQVRGVMLAAGVKKPTNSTRVKIYYAQNLYRYEHMLVHRVLLPLSAVEEIKNMNWRKGHVSVEMGAKRGTATTDNTHAPMVTDLEKKEYTEEDGSN